MSSECNYNLFKNLVLYTAVIAFIGFLFFVKDVVIIFFAAYILASAIDPLVELLSKKIPRKYSLIIVSVSIFLLIIVFLIPFLNVFIQQVLKFLELAPSYWARAEANVSNFIQQISVFGFRGAFESFNIPDWVLSFKDMGVFPDMSNVMSFASDIGKNIVESSILLTQEFFKGITLTITATIVTIYMLMDKKYLSGKIMRLFPEDFREKAEYLLRVLSKKVGGYVVSQLIILATLGLLVTLGLMLLKIQFALILGSIAAVLELIPVIGPVITTITIALVALAQKPVIAIWAVVIYLLIEWGVDNFLKPVILGKFLDIHPLTLIFSIFAGAIIMGVPGVLLAPAVAAMISVIIEELYTKRINSESPDDSNLKITE